MANKHKTKKMVSMFVLIRCATSAAINTECASPNTPTQISKALCVDKAFVSLRIKRIIPCISKKAKASYISTAPFVLFFAYA